MGTYEGTFDQALLYCQKECLNNIQVFTKQTWNQNRQTIAINILDLITYGEIPSFKRGPTPETPKPHQLTEVANKVAEGASLHQLAIDYPLAMIHHSKKIQQWKELLQDKPRNIEIEPITLVLWGDAGLGKTKWVYDSFDQDKIYTLQGGNTGNIWWQGYEHQPIVLIDEYYGWIPLYSFLKITDRYPMRVEYKGGSTQLTSTIFIICSNKDPNEWYNNLKGYSVQSIDDDNTGLYTAFHRRLTHVFHYQKTQVGIS